MKKKSKKKLVKQASKYVSSIGERIDREIRAKDPTKKGGPADWT